MLSVLGAIFQESNSIDNEDQSIHTLQQQQQLTAEGVSGEQILKRIEQAVKSVKRGDPRTTG